jgi:hypothetical protein
MTTDSATEIIEATDKITNIQQKVEIPFSLREIGEIPKSFVPVYLTVRSESLNHIAENGLRIGDNQMTKDAPEEEAIFSQAAKEAGVNIDRTRCVFAYPRHPDKLQMSFSPDPKRILLEAWIDPNSEVLVADAETYTTAVSKMGYANSEDSVAETAQTYWTDAKIFKNYLNEKHTGDENDKDFRIPEVLIPYDIPTSRIRVAK